MDKEKLDRVSEEKKELERKCEERERQMKDLEEKMGRTTERTVDLERHVAELKDQKQVTVRVLSCKKCSSVLVVST